MPSRFVKDPSAVLDYRVDWTDWLGQSETIVSSSWTVPSGINKDSDTIGDGKATIWLSGGTRGQDYTLTNRIATNAARVDERSIVIMVRSR